MKAGERKKVADAYGKFLSAPWKRVGNNYLRWEGDWVQMLAFYGSRWDSRYQPRSCFEFLKDPGEAMFGYLACPLVYSRSGTECWVTVSETARSAPAIFKDMAAQFKPSILTPLSVLEIKRLLEAEIEYWPHAYALCVMAAEAGDKTAAKRYLAAFESDVANKPYDWAEKARHELNSYIREIGTETLKGRLAKVRFEKLRALKLAP